MRGVSLGSRRSVCTTGEVSPALAMAAYHTVTYHDEPSEDCMREGRERGGVNTMAGHLRGGVHECYQHAR